VSIGHIGGICGSLSEYKGYSFLDENPIVNKPVYYRIFAGNEGYSMPKEIFIDDIQLGEVKVYPNVSDNVIVVKFKNLQNTNTFIKIYNELGQPILEKETLGQSVELSKNTI